MTGQDLQWFASLGVGGVLAGFMFTVYRADRKASEERYEKLALEFRKLVQENTAAFRDLLAELRSEFRAR